MLTPFLKGIFLLSALTAPTVALSEVTHDHSDASIYICQAFNSDGMIVAMQMARDEALARIKVWEICHRQDSLECRLVQCYQNF